MSLTNSQIKNLSPQQRAYLAEILRRGLTLPPELSAILRPAREKLTFRQFIERANPRYRFYRHTKTLIAALQKVADGEIKRLMIFMPPRHGKSETASRLFPAYFLYRYPQYFVALTSYAAELAQGMSRNVRENYTRVTGELEGATTAVKHWETGYGGGLWAAGVGGPATGKGFQLGIIDDPIKNAEEAASDAIRQRNEDWYNSTWYSREEPWSEGDVNGAQILIQTRWHENDPAGWLLEQERNAEDEEDRERWHIINLPAIAEETDPEQFPSSCTVEADWREPGEALCPERRPIEKLRRIQKRIGDYFFDALFQQRPTAKEGDFFKVANFKTCAALPIGLLRCRAWDLAATTEKEASSATAYTAGVGMGKDPATGYWYVWDVHRGRWSSDEVERQLAQTAALDGQSVSIHLPQDPGQAGRGQATQLVRKLAGYNVKAEPVTGSKETRARAYSAQVNAGNVYLLDAPWNKAFIEEHRQFPRGKLKDQVDAAADGFNELALGAGQSSQGKLVR